MTVASVVAVVAVATVAGVAVAAVANVVAVAVAPNSRMFQQKLETRSNECQEKIIEKSLSRLHS